MINVYLLLDLYAIADGCTNEEFSLFFCGDTDYKTTAFQMASYEKWNSIIGWKCLNLELQLAVYKLVAPFNKLQPRFY